MLRSFNRIKREASKSIGIRNVEIPQTQNHMLHHLRMEMERNGVELEDDGSDCGIVINLPHNDSESDQQSVKFCLSLGDCSSSSRASSFCDDRALSGVFDKSGNGDKNDSANGSPTDAADVALNTKKEFRLSKLLAISTDEKIERRLAVESERVKNSADKDKISNDNEVKGAGKGIYNETQEFEYLATEPVRRSTSLKTGKSSGSSCTQKKVVRFADAMGLDLESVKHIMGQEEPPIVPISAIKDLNLTDTTWGSTGMSGYGSNDNMLSGPTGLTEVHRLCFCFAQLGYSPDYFQRVLERSVMLEMAEADDINKVIRGIVGVANRAFDKTVTVRWSQNSWYSYEDVPAVWVSSANGGTIDRFEFKIHLPEYFGVGCKLEFSVQYTCAGDAYWDSNYGANYRVECYLGTEVRWKVGAGFNDPFDSDPFY